MVQRLCTLLVLVAFVAGLGLAGNSKIDKPTFPSEAPTTEVVNVTRTPDGLAPTAKPLAGTYTTLSGFYDYQSNGGACQQIRVNPATGNIHVIMQVGIDSAAVSTGRRTAYAYSTDGGASWNNFGDLLVPNRRSGFATLDIGQGPIAGAAIVANHSTISGTQSSVLVDFPEGSGAFTETPAPPTFGTDDPIWPFIAGASDGSVIMHASRSAAGTNHLTATADFSTWSAWKAYPDTNSSGGRYPTKANSLGHVGSLLNATSNGVYWLESTDNGATWPANSVQIHPPSRIVPPDTFQVYVGADFVYDGNTPYIVMNDYNAGANEPTDGARISFWSQATGLKVIATKATTPGVATSLNRSQSNQLTMGYPVIGMSGSTIVVAFVGAQTDTSAAGFNYMDIFMVQSANGGVTWTAPINISNTPILDERFPSMSPWNAPGQVNLVWQEDPEPGSSAFTDNAPLRRSRQVFLRMNTSGVATGREVPTGFALNQNYPNPFNPSTTIDYMVKQLAPVNIKVYNALGQEVATLVNETRAPGQYQVTFDASSLASGVYMYRMQAGSFVESKKMMLLK